MAWTFIVVAYVAGLAFSPFLLWRSFLSILVYVVVSAELNWASKARLAVHLLKELSYAPVYTMLWWIDEIAFHGYHKATLRDPVFIMSQPRSGTTFLLRTLSQDRRTFFALKHLEWRYPFIVFWLALDRLGLRDRVERISYWPETDVGRAAAKLHFHVLGSFEEHGIFFEERMYHHYFTFRRFPLPPVLRRVTEINDLREREKAKLIRTFKRVVQKAAYYRGGGRIWLTKENESVDLYRLLHAAFANARFLVIARPPEAFVSSYITMSNVCTVAKHGIDPAAIRGWHEDNLQFRRDQCLKQQAFCRELERRGMVMYITYAQFTTNIKQTIDHIYRWLGLTPDEEYAAVLTGLEADQPQREPGYSNEPCGIAGFEAFDAFVRELGMRTCAGNARGDTLGTDP